jgi:hypothetical protein
MAGGGVMANLNSVPSERSHDIWQDWARQLDDAQRSGLDAPDRASLFDSLLTDDDRKFLWAMWIDFRHTAPEVA